MGRERGDGSWEAWLEFDPIEPDSTTRYETEVETHQRERLQLERWASGLTHVYAEGALERAHVRDARSSSPDLLVVLQELVEALDRRVPHVERAGESQIAADAERLRASAARRIASLRAPAAVRT
jgi:hypothetical protein